MNIFLIEKKSSLNNHRPNLALARISTMHKEKGDCVFHYVLSSKLKKVGTIRPDKVYISIVFSWDVPYFINFINKLKKIYKLENKDIVIGGVCTLYMKDLIEQGTGISPVIGCSKELDHVIPDADFYEDDTTYLFTMRSCPNKCSYCIVNDLEPESYIINNWKDQINLDAKYIVLEDNDLLAASYEHRVNVFSYLSEIANVKGTKIPGSRKVREVIFDGGFDFRHLTRENLELMKNIKFSKIKIAFDDIRYEEKFHQGMDLLLEYFPKVSKRGIHENIECYVLYNCNFTKDTLEDTLYRIYKLKFFYKVLPYVMRFQPLDTIKYKSYVSPHWDENECVDIGRWANNRIISMKVSRYKEYYGRKEDGKCLNSTTKELKEILSLKKSKELLPFDFTKGFKYNLQFIKKEISDRRNELNNTDNSILKYEQIAM